MFSGLPFSYLFVFTMFFGTFFSLSSSHWLGVWAGLEVNLIGFLPMLVYSKKVLESESAVKYFVVQALGSSFLMFGSLLGYNLSFSWEVVSQSSFLVFSGGLFLVLGLFIKMGVFPFHFWLPSVMAGLSWMACLLLATWQKIAPIFLLASFLSVSTFYITFFLFCLLGAGSSMAGGLGGMNQTQIRALLAYSSIGHMGWMLFAICCGESSVKIYFLVYVLISICIFISLWAMDSGNLKNLSVLSLSSKGEVFSFLVMLLSLGGLPPLLGFIPKWAVVSTGVSTGFWGFLLFLVFGSLISLFYYLSLFFSEVLGMKMFLEVDFKEKVMNVYSDFAVLVNLLGGFVLVLFLPMKFF
uniref:NADH-ubiquinone oxidoreductase chain 2 n=1 Tax=Turritella bacillum TaxID=1088899 RepID=A0A140GAZ5_9CAEN|nr:NADH dehydrogenase subunit 2 [Turritella bacillum]AMM72630.1 NADH dehydrogenase subunit 2 [Turritella bacillum]